MGLASCQSVLYDGESLREEEEEEERQNVMVRGVTNGGLSHGNPHERTNSHHTVSTLNGTQADSE